ncbi:MAG: O-antigen ligase family protein [Desulfitobacteriaceae bacterium]
MSLHILVAIATILALLAAALKIPEMILAVYINGMFIATLLLTDTGIPFFAGGSIFVVTVIGIGWYVFKYVGWRDLWNIMTEPLSLLVLLIALDLALAYVYSNHSSYGILKIVRYLSLNAFIFFSLIILGKDRYRINSFLKFVLIFGVLYSLASVLGMLFGVPNAMYGWNNRIWFSRSLGLTLILFYFFWGAGQKRKYVLLALTTLFFLAMMFLNASRGPVIALYCALAAFELFDFTGKTVSHRVAKILVITIVFYVIFWSGSALTKPLEDAAAHNNQFITINDKFESDAGGTANQRILIWKYTLQEIKAHPLLGIGTGSFHMVYPSTGNIYVYPHNLILEVWVEQGPIGLLLWLVLILYPTYLALRGLWTNSEGNEIYLLGLVLLVYGLVNALLSGDITDNSYIFVAVGLIGSARILERRELSW